MTRERFSIGIRTAGHGNLHDGEVVDATRQNLRRHGFRQVVFDAVDCLLNLLLGEDEICAVGEACLND